MKVGSLVITGQNIDFVPLSIAQLKNESQLGRDDMMSRVSSISVMSKMTKNRNRLFSDMNNKRFQNFLQSSPDARKAMPMPSIAIKGVIDTEARENKRKATALNNPITGFSAHVAQSMSTATLKPLKEEEVDDYEMANNLASMGSIDVKNRNRLPEIKPSGIDLR